MKRSLSMIAALAALLSVTFAGVVAAETRKITVAGEGRVTTEPDMATITLGVTHEAREARAAMQATSESVGAMLDRLAAMGIEPRDLQTRRITLSPVWVNRNNASGQAPRITGFTASNTVMVRVRDLAGLGDVLDAVIDDGANEFNGLRFGVQAPEPLVEEARKRAVADAMAKARVLADAAGVALGPVLSINEQGGGRPMPMAEMAMRDSGGGVPVAAGEIALNVSVSMEFAIAE